MTAKEPRFDEIGYWSEVKLDIVRDYAAEYSKILSAQRDPSFHHVYVDGFSGPGVHLKKLTGDFVSGSPLNALSINPPFREHFLVDLDGDKVEFLRRLVGDRPDVHVLHGDCNEVLLKHIFPKVRFEDFRRGLCLLDPYGLHLSWEVIREAGQMKSLDLFLNFPIMDMNRNALWRDPARVSAESARRMTAFWGDETWRTEAYRPPKQLSLLEGEETEKVTNDEVAKAFQRRLRDVAGFKEVPTPLAMRNSGGAVVYYLFFASPKNVAGRIVKHIFQKYENRS